VEWVKPETHNKSYEFLVKLFILVEFKGQPFAQAETFLNADWLKRAVFVSNTCHIWERVVFQGFDF